MENFQQQLDVQNEKLDAIYQSTEKTRKYILVIMWSSVAVIVLPLIFAALVLPSMLSSLSSLYGVSGNFSI